MWTFFLIYTLISALATWFIYHNQKRFYTELMISKKDSPTAISIHKEFEEFCRKDQFNLVGLFIGTFIFFWLRFILLVLIASSCMIILLIKNSKLKVKGVVNKEERESFRKVIHYHTSLFLLLSGICITVTRPDVSVIYKKYFGPEYKIQYNEGYACIISNHISFIVFSILIQSLGYYFQYEAIRFWVHIKSECQVNSHNRLNC